MSKKEIFVKEIKDLISSSNYKWNSPDAEMYWNCFSTTNDENKPAFTDNGRLILKYMRDNQSTPMFKAKDIGDGLTLSSRTVAGGMRKLVTDGYVEKLSQEPTIYALTEAGKNVNIND